MESSLSQRHMQSVVTEKGAYQIHGNHIRDRIHRRRRLNPLHYLVNTPTEKLLTSIIVILFALMCMSFVWAYHLYSSGCVSVISFSRPGHSRLGSDSSSTNPPVVVELDRSPGVSESSPTTKYLSYLPHSGFHNQRIALENALVMARILNRTLLVPPVRLGKGILTYYPFDHLYDLVTLMGKDGLSHCTNVSAWKVLPIECSDYYDYTLLPWNWLTNISSLAARHPMLSRWNMSDAWLSSELNISASDVFSVKDTTAYQFRFVDSDPLDMPGLRFREVVSTALLAQLPNRLIQLGTLFGSSRLRLREEENLQFRTEVREAMVFSNPTLVALAESISTKLGGKYLAAHLRLGDGPFERKANKNVRLSYWRLLSEELHLDDELILTLESEIRNTSSQPSPPTLQNSNAFYSPPANVPDLPDPTSVHPTLPCRRPLHTDPRLSVLNLPFFVSSDSSPSHASLPVFKQTFPCTFFLSDFTDELAELRRMQSGYDGLMMEKFVIPFLDAIVAGKAERVVGTEGSTFSQFVLDVLWRRYHGWDIVQRG